MLGTSWDYYTASGALPMGILWTGQYSIVQSLIIYIISVGKDIRHLSCGCFSKLSAEDLPPRLTILPNEPSILSLPALSRNSDIKLHLWKKGSLHSISEARS